MKKIIENCLRGTGLIVLFLIISFRPSQELYPQDLIKGTWCLEEESQIKLVFTNDQMIEYSNISDISAIYNWKITSEVSSSGIKHNYLEVINSQDSTETYIYEITTLNLEFLGLVNIASGNLSPVTYKKI